MLFDLSGKRKSVVRVVYAALAVVFGGGFLLFGFGSETGLGGIGDLFGFGTGGQSSSDPAFEQEIEDAETRLAADPKDEGALGDLVTVRFQSGNAILDQNTDQETLEVTPTAEAEQEFRASTSAWEDYVEVVKKPDESVAAVANNAYGTLLQFFADPADVPTLAKDAVRPSEIVAGSNPGVGSYSTLAQYAYFAGETELGDEAADKAIAEVDASQRKQIERDLEATRKAAAQLQRQISKQAEKGGGEEAFSNPFQQGIGGGGPSGAPTP